MESISSFKKKSDSDLNERSRFEKKLVMMVAECTPEPKSRRWVCFSKKRLQNQKEILDPDPLILIMTVSECAPEPNPRRWVCSNQNETYESDCQLYKAKISAARNYVLFH